MSSASPSGSPHRTSTSSTTPTTIATSRTHPAVHPTKLLVHVPHTRLHGKPSASHELTCRRVHDTHGACELRHHCHLVEHHLLQHHRICHAHSDIHPRHAVHREAAVHQHHVGVWGTVRDAVNAGLHVVVSVELWAMAVPWTHAIQ